MVLLALSSGQPRTCDVVESSDLVTGSSTLDTSSGIAPHYGVHLQDNDTLALNSPPMIKITPTSK